MIRTPTAHSRELMQKAQVVRILGAYIAQATVSMVNTQVHLDSHLAGVIGGTRQTGQAKLIQHPDGE